MARNEKRFEPLHTARLKDAPAEEVRRAHERAINELRLRLEELEREHEKYKLPRTCEIGITATRAGTQGKGAGNHFEFTDARGVLIREGLVKVSSGTGQDQGLITLKGGHAFRVHGNFYGDVVNNGHRTVQFEMKSPSNGSNAGEIIGRNGLSARYITTMDTDLNNVTRARGSVTWFETNLLRQDAVFRFEFVSSHAVLREGTSVLITEITP